MDDVERLASEVIRRLKGNETGTRESGGGETGAGEPRNVALSGAATSRQEPAEQESRDGGTPAGIPVAVSGRHIHVARGVLDRLFGEGFQLTKLRDLGQPGEFASEQTVTVVGRSTKALECVRVLGPVRSYTQIELSGTDAVRLAIDPPVRPSGDLIGSESVTVAGPCGSVYLKASAIMATRHLHMTERDAREHGVADGDRVRIRFTGDRAVVFENVLVRVGKNSALELHLDTDDANAAGLRLPMTVKILR
ncbi:MAG: phosphate propanoyltransferase [Candidatus Eisenbacteria sp.]|nr:phosphate propanoyltransferase [Candidatus Eisenbacteria bacterium]